MLEINNLTKSFSKKAKAVDNFSYSFGDGVYALLGPNGAGKTTLMRCLTTLYPISTGEVKYCGKSISKNPEYTRVIGYLPQSFGLFKELSVKEGLELVANMKKIPREQCLSSIEEALETVNLADRLRSRIGSLSGGMIRRLGIAQAIMGDPKVIIFDEPTAGLDPEERLRFKNIVNLIKHDKTIIISTHIVDDVDALCDKIVIMNQGTLAQSGTCTEIKSLAEGKVYALESERQSEVTSAFTVQSQYEENGVNMLRILSSEPLPLQTVKPNLEDGYICALKKI